MEKKYKYIEFSLLIDDSKAKKPAYFIKNILSGDVLGFVRYYPKWRKYVLEPAKDTIWDINCIKDVLDFIENYAGK